MKRDLGNKQQSQRGASIIMALFLFLVCSVIAAIILAAATAASGRAAGLAESDQKYYSVMSAAELYRAMMMGDADEVSVVVTCEKETQLESVTGGVSGGAANSPSTTCSISSAAGSEAPIDSVGDSSPLLDQAVKSLVSSGAAAGESLADAAWKWDFGSAQVSGDPQSKSVKFSHESAGLTGEQKALLDDVVITEKVYPGGTIEVSFSSGPASTGALPYTAELVCEPSAESSVKMRVVRDSASGSITRIETKTTTIKWQATELRVGGA